MTGETPEVRSDKRVIRVIRVISVISAILSKKVKVCWASKSCHFLIICQMAQWPPWQGTTNSENLKEKTLNAFFNCFGWKKVFLGTERRLRSTLKKYCPFSELALALFSHHQLFACFHLLLCACLDFCTKLPTSTKQPCPAIGKHFATVGKYIGHLDVT